MYYLVSIITSNLCRVLDSVKNGTRMPETPYSVLQVAAKGQQSVYNMFKKDKFQENQAEI